MYVKSSDNECRWRVHRKNSKKLQLVINDSSVDSIYLCITGSVPHNISVAFQAAVGEVKKMKFDKKLEHYPVAQRQRIRAEMYLKDPHAMKEFEDKVRDIKSARKNRIQRHIQNGRDMIKFNQDYSNWPKEISRKHAREKHKQALSRDMMRLRRQMELEKRTRLGQNLESSIETARKKRDSHLDAFRRDIQDQRWTESRRATVRGHLRSMQAETQRQAVQQEAQKTSRIQWRNIKKLNKETAVLHAMGVLKRTDNHMDKYSQVLKKKQEEEAMGWCTNCHQNFADNFCPTCGQAKVPFFIKNVRMIQRFRRRLLRVKKARVALLSKIWDQALVVYQSKLANVPPAKLEEMKRNARKIHKRVLRRREADKLLMGNMSPASAKKRGLTKQQRKEKDEHEIEDIIYEMQLIQEADAETKEKYLLELLHSLQSTHRQLQVVHSKAKHEFIVQRASSLARGDHQLSESELKQKKELVKDFLSRRPAPVFKVVVPMKTMVQIMKKFINDKNEEEFKRIRETRRARYLSADADSVTISSSLDDITSSASNQTVGSPHSPTTPAPFSLSSVPGTPRPIRSSSIAVGSPRRLRVNSKVDSNSTSGTDTAPQARNVNASADSGASPGDVPISTSDST